MDDDSRSSDPDEQLVVGAFGEARNVRFVQQGRPEETTCAGDSSLALPAASEGSDHLFTLREKVLRLAVAFFAFIVMRRVIVYMFTITELDDVLRDIRNMAPASVDLYEIPHTLLSFLSLYIELPAVLVLLLIPMCGYIGAKHNNRACSACFCGCSFVLVCCTLSGLVLAGFYLSIINETGPVVESWLQDCDPALVCDTMELDREHAIDCLAAPLITKELRRFPEGRHMPDKCAPVGLACTGEDHVKWRQYCLHMGASACESTGKCRVLCSAYGDCGCTSLLQVTGETPESLSDMFENWESLVEVTTMPDLFATCEVDQAQVDTFHALSRLAPSFRPKLIALVIVQFLLGIPLAVLSCLGFLWGKELHDLQGGYAPGATHTTFLEAGDEAYRE